MKRIALFAALALAALAFVASSSAQTAHTAQMYKNPGYTCATGAAPSGTSYGTLTEYQAHRTIYGTVVLKGVPAYTQFTIRVIEDGAQCLGPVDVTTLTTDAHGNGYAHFAYAAHSGESTAWVSAFHSSSIVYRSTAVPINQ